MSDTVQTNFVMTIDGEDTFEVYRFGYDSTYLNSPGSRFSLQLLCNMIEERKTMVFTKRSDLITVRLVEAYYQKKTLDRVFFVVTQTVNKTRTTTWVAAVDLKDVSIVDLKTRQQVGVLPSGERLLIDVVSLRANGAFERDYDERGNPELKIEERKALYNQG
jgi:type VI protein secretion system component Hcp